MAILLLSGRMFAAIFDIPMSFNFLFFAKPASASLRCRSLTIDQLVLPSLWHATISFLSIFTPVSLTSHNAKLSKSLFSTILGMPVKCKHFLLEYCSKLCCYLSRSASFSLVFWNACKPPCNHQENQNYGQVTQI